MCFYSHRSVLSIIKNVFFLSALFATGLNAQTLIYNNAIKDGVDGVDGLDGTYGIAISPDDMHIYTASSTDDAVTGFARNAVNGNLSIIEIHKDDGQPGGLIHGLRDAKRLAISPDGKHIYVPSTGDDAIVVFSRNATTGALTYVQTIEDDVDGIDGLNGVYSLVVSNDNNYLYSAGSTDDAISVFSRNTSTGQLTFVEMIKDDVNGVEGLNGVRDITISDDGNFVYSAASQDDAITVFSRNTSTGQLTFVEMIKDAVDGIDGLNSAYGLFISPDNNHIYAASSSDDAVAVFSRNTYTGQLTFVEVHKDDSQGGSIVNLNAARYIYGISDGNYVFASSSSDHGLVVFSRNQSTGVLTVLEEFKDEVNGVDGLNGARALVVSNDNKNVYTIGSTDDAISIFNMASALPIKLTYFNVKLKKEGTTEIRITWATETQLNNDFFTVEHSRDGTSWNAIKIVQGEGTSNQTTDYEVIDDQLEGLHYYRLKQTDFNGNVSYSEIRSLHLQNKILEQLKIYPNPVLNTLIVEGNEIGKLHFFNSLGQNVTHLTTIIKDGENEIEVNLSQLLNGKYTLKSKNKSFLIYKI